MLVSIDEAKGVVTLYGATVVTVPILQYKRIAPMLRGKTVEYVREITLESGEDVVALLEDIAASGTVSQPDVEELDTDGKLWLHATGSGYLNIPAAHLIFNGPMDFKSLDKHGYDIADRFPQVKTLLEKKKLEVVSTSQMAKIQKIEAQREKDKDDMMYGNLIVDFDVSKANPRDARANARLVRGASVNDPIDLGVIEDNSGRDPTREGEAYNALSDEQKLAFKMGWGKPDAPPTTKE